MDFYFSNVALNFFFPYLKTHNIFTNKNILAGDFLALI
ncbi:hypothetical protein CJA_3764 [Cellvibrio japonicus Ueda107]|uniref:Uncharacterized protein n=1 Tax=Cellvibrio japonicus (strain Ueda107) TaxID=498211 RepID=B3PIN3_CELJU|nr:hypothetical protein CJA_3764 [Cellvibrio japonicus Ueda107]